MPFDVCLHQLPRKLEIEQRDYEIEYTPLKDGTDSDWSGMLVVISDVTERIAAERAEGEQRELVAAFNRVMADRAAFVDFLAEARGMVSALVGDERRPLVEVKRLLHTLKGNAASFGLNRLSSLCHRLEDVIEQSSADLSPANRTELATHWQRFTGGVRALFSERAERGMAVDEEDYDAVVQAVQRGASREELARALAEWKLERVDHRLARFAEQARELGVRLGKGEVTVEVEAGRLRLAREPLAPFWGAFTHVVRNAIDHGLEPPRERVDRGKSSSGTLKLWAKGTDRVVTVGVSDDGRGVDWDAVAARAKQAGLAHARRDDLVRALFHEGMSTQAAPTEVSGRGIGLAAVRVECEKLGGTCSVESDAGRGTTFSFAFPRERVNSG
jgi:two-component system chemotaxis sensor kinase CheA